MAPCSSGHGVLDALERAGSRVRTGYGGDRWTATCPAHDDRSPSLSLRRLHDGTMLLHCFAGCETGAILTELDLEWSDLFPNRRSVEDLVGLDDVPGSCPWPDKRKHPTEFAVLEFIHDHGFDSPDGIRISQELIAAGLGIARETVNRACAWLRVTGRLQWHQELHPGAKWRHNVYGLLVTWTKPYRKFVLFRLNRAKNALRLRATSSTATQRSSSTSPRVPLSVMSTGGESGKSRFGAGIAVDFTGVEPWLARAGP